MSTMSPNLNELQVRYLVRLADHREAEWARSKISMRRAHGIDQGRWFNPVQDVREHVAQQELIERYRSNT
jgi:hypothetical protein